MKITNYKSQITNKSQSQNYKLQTVGAKNFSPILRAEKNANVQFSMTDNLFFSLTLTTNTDYVMAVFSLLKDSYALESIISFSKWTVRQTS